jgi:hypothetical protein
MGLLQGHAGYCLRSPLGEIASEIGNLARHIPSVFKSHHRARAAAVKRLARYPKTAQVPGFEIVPSFFAIGEFNET